MKLIIQRVKEASCSVNDKEISKINTGYMILVGFGKDDTIDIINKAIHKVLKLRIFEDECNKMNKSILDVSGSILLISQFTLNATLKKQNRPGFSNSMEFKKAFDFYNYMLDEFNKSIKTYGGSFGNHMQIHLVNDGPCTIIIDDECL